MSRRIIERTVPVRVAPPTVLLWARQMTLTGETSEGWVELPGGYGVFMTVPLVKIDHAPGYLIRNHDGKGYTFWCLECVVSVGNKRQNSHDLQSGQMIPMPPTVNPPVCGCVLHPKGRPTPA